MVDDELTFAGEELGERLFAVRAIEDVLLHHLLPGQIATSLFQAVMQSREFLFLHKEGFAGGEPFLGRYDLVFVGTGAGGQLGHDFLHLLGGFAQARRRVF